MTEAVRAQVESWASERLLGQAALSCPTLGNWTPSNELGNPTTRAPVQQKRRSMRDRGDGGFYTGQGASSSGKALWQGLTGEGARASADERVLSAPARLCVGTHE